MATDDVERGHPRRSHSDTPEDVRLSPEEHIDLVNAVSDTFASQRDADNLLRRIGFPAARIPTFDGDQRTRWRQWNDVFHDLSNGIIATPYRRLLEGVLRIYPGHPVLRPIADQHHVKPPMPIQVELPPDPEPPTGRPSSRSRRARRATSAPQDRQPPAPDTGASSEPVPTCHVIVRASADEERHVASQTLTNLGLSPNEAWSSTHAVSFRINATDVAAVRRLLDDTELAWTVVPPGEPDYLLQRLYVEGPDRRRFLVTDAPAQQTVRNVATEIIQGEYSQRSGDSSLSTVIDHVRNGVRRRLRPDSTLHDAEVRDGDELRVAYQTNAGAVNPDDHEDALSKAQIEIARFAESRPDFHVRVDNPILPTEYELTFERPSFAPGPTEGSEPVPRSHHVVLLQLGEQFPIESPVAWWLTPIFHPNVYPNYDCEPARAHPESRGWVCLGEVGESWQPGADFADLCQMLIDIAGFRSYALVAPTGEIGPDGRPTLTGNYIDLDAARWVAANGDRIAAIGGVRCDDVQAHPEPTPYRNVIEAL